MVLDEKSFLFAVRIVKFYQYMMNNKKEFVLFKQILRSGTSIGANIKEAKYAQSVADMISKYSIARKEANETIYWLKLLKETDIIDNNSYSSLNNDCEELIKILTTSIKTLKAKESNGN
ncbi:MAG: four helix bundle protein [Paludibacteraceae bacterium]|nr:four helix bundle protein [Paludibacteraceae bacterium]